MSTLSTLVSYTLICVHCLLTRPPYDQLPSEFLDLAEIVTNNSIYQYMHCIPLFSFLIVRVLSLLMHALQSFQNLMYLLYRHCQPLWITVTSNDLFKLFWCSHICKELLQKVAIEETKSSDVCITAASGTTWCSESANILISLSWKQGHQICNLVCVTPPTPWRTPARFLCNAVRCSESWSSRTSTMTPIRPEEVKKICFSSNAALFDESEELSDPLYGVRTISR